jgi:hypothetical protein
LEKKSLEKKKINIPEMINLSKINNGENINLEQEFYNP